MRLDELVGSDMILVGISPPNRKAALAAIAQQMAWTTDVPAERILDALNEREKLGSTGFGGGIAIPHGRLPEISDMTGCIAVLASPVDYDAVDGRPVDILFALLAPEDGGVEHLKTLARVSRAFRDQRFLARLRGARDAAAVRAILCADNTSEAA